MKSLVRIKHLTLQDVFDGVQSFGEKWAFGEQ
jgi:hypothetical protein